MRASGSDVTFPMSLEYQVAEFYCGVASGSMGCELDRGLSGAGHPRGRL